MRYAVTRIAAKFSSMEKGLIHPLICHMVDVASVAEAIWEDCLAERVRLHLTRSFQPDENFASRLSEETVGRWVAFLAGAHDLGKATPVFQAKGSSDRHSRPPWLKDTDLPFAQNGPSHDPGHGTVTAAHLGEILTSRFQLSQPDATRLAVITGGHHGIFPSATSRKNAQHTSIGEPRRGQPNPWAAAREELANELAALLAVEGTPGKLSNAASMLLAGLISVVDWIGSIDLPEYFPYDPNGPRDLNAYLAGSRQRARQAVRLLHWNAWPVLAAPASFQAVFPAIAEPRDLQLTAERVAAEIDVPGLVILEAPMGEGKTEAAFYLADFWNASGFRGSYIAMPTQATSNQLYQRFLAFLKGRYQAGEKINLQLLHGHSALSAEIELLNNGDVTPTPIGVDMGGGDVVKATVGAAEWFTYRKRGLLAPFGVGTVDQALLSVLQVRHGFVRLFGLAGKTVVIDEIHAYDTYMSTLLERLLEWLAALGSPVVMLSATLPSEKRRDLLNAYLRGLGRAHNKEMPLPEGKYPRITWSAKSGIRADTVEASTETRRKLGVEWLPVDPESLPDYLLNELRDGGCAAVICNTVRRAQEVYAALRDAYAELPGTDRPQLDLFHARFLFKDRQVRERRCLARFGKPNRHDGTTAARPRRAVLVATQVVEQSLDLDFDFMVSELAPMDLLLQRSGRLHRHQRNDRCGPPRPVLRILSPDLDDHSLPVFEPGAAFVYDEHILLRTWHALQGRNTVAVPEDVEQLIEVVYTNSAEPPVGASGNLAARWAKTFSALEIKRRDERDEAQMRRIPSPSGGARLEDHTRDPREEDAPDLHPALQALTRLTDLSVQVALLAANSPLQEATRATPTMRICREILRHSLSITAPGIGRELLASSPPAAWQKSGLLRRMRVLSLDEANTCQVGNVTLRYDLELGLVRSQ